MQEGESGRGFRPVAVGSGERRVEIGGPAVTWWCGPCAIESRQQIMSTAAFLRSHGVPILRGGAFKPRTSPRSFQGLGVPALGWLAEAGRKYKMTTVTEVLDTAHARQVADYADILQVGTRNMQNYALLKLLGRMDRPVLLKRGMGCTLEEFVLAAEYLLDEGNERVVLCERGSRTFETATRATLDLAVAVLARRRINLPVIADISHSLGRVDLMPDVARACVAAGMDGIMCEVHPAPDTALCDGGQSLDFEQFAAFKARVEPFALLIERERSGREQWGEFPAGTGPDRTSRVGAGS